MDKSLFSAIRIVAHMLQIDGEFSEEEKSWFENLVWKSGASEEQQKILAQDAVKGIDLYDVFASVIETKDRANLMNLVETAMLADGKISPAEDKLFETLLEYNRLGSPKVREAYGQIAGELVDHTNRIDFWQQLKAAGKTLNFRFFRGKMWP